MRRTTILTLYRAAFALLTFVAIGFQIYRLADVGDFKPGNFFSFFTIESNIFAATLLLYLAWRGSTDPVHQGRLDLIRGAATLYMLTTGIVYDQLLSGYTAELQTAVIWVDNVVHRMMPVVIVIDWLADPPKTSLTVRRALVWLAFPLVYLAYSLIRGPLVDWYPYPFLNPDEVGGYLGVVGISLAIAVGVIILTWVITRLGEWRRREDARAAAAATSA